MLVTVAGREEDDVDDVNDALLAGEAVDAEAGTPVPVAVEELADATPEDEAVEV